MTTTSTTPRGVPGSPSRAMLQLARMEGRRMLRHPAVWVGLVGTALLGYGGFHSDDYAGTQYETVAWSVWALLLGISLASAPVFAREHIPVGEDAPLDRDRVAAARLLGGLWLVGLMLVVVVVGAIAIATGGGIELGDEPGRLTGIAYSIPEMAQPVLLAGYAVAIGAVAGHLTRIRSLASIALFVYWLMLGMFWLWSLPGIRYLTPLQILPFYDDLPGTRTNPIHYPSDWILGAPEWQEGWTRLIVSPDVAVAHDVYLLGLTLLLSAVLISTPRTRRQLVTIGALLAVTGVVAQGIAGP